MRKCAFMWVCLCMFLFSRCCCCLQFSVWGVRVLLFLFIDHHLHIHSAIKRRKDVGVNFKDWQAACSTAKVKACCDESREERAWQPLTLFLWFFSVNWKFIIISFPFAPLIRIRQVYVYVCVGVIVAYFSKNTVLLEDSRGVVVPFDVFFYILLPSYELFCFFFVHLCLLYFTIFRSF